MAGAIILTSPRNTIFTCWHRVSSHFKYGEYNSYNLPDRDKHDRLGKEKCNTMMCLNIIRGLIQLRKSFSAFRLHQMPRKWKRLRFFDGYDEHLIAFTLTNEGTET